MIATATNQGKTRGMIIDEAFIVPLGSEPNGTVASACALPRDGIVSPRRSRTPDDELKCLPAKLRPLTTCPNFFSMEKPIPPISAGRTGRIPRRRRKEARPGELQAAALELFIEKGFTATRLDDVAARAGVAKGTLYLYFDSKVELFQSVVDETMTPTLDAADHLIDTHAGSSEELIRRLITNLWEHVVGSPLEGMTRLV